MNEGLFGQKVAALDSCMKMQCGVKTTLQSRMRNTLGYYTGMIKDKSAHDNLYSDRSDTPRPPPTSCIWWTFPFHISFPAQLLERLSSFS